MEILILWNMCRLCIQEDGPDSNMRMRSIYGDTKLMQEIFECTGIKIAQNDSLPDKVCRKCLLMLKSAVHFRTTCQNSDSYLQNVIAQTKTATSLFKRKETQDLVVDLDNISEDDALESFKNKNNNRRKIVNNETFEEEVDDDDNEIQSDNEDIATIKDHDENEFELVAIERREDIDMYNEEFIENSETCKQLISENYTEDIEHLEDVSTDDLEKKIVIEPNHKLKALHEEYIISFHDNDMEDNCQNEEQSTNSIENNNSIERKLTEEENNDESNSDIYYIYNNKIKQEPIESIQNQIYRPHITADTHKSDAELSEMEDKEDINVDVKVIHSQNSTKKNTKKIGSTKIVTKKEISFLCNTCGNCFSDKKVMNYHMRMHRNERKHECELCSKRFNSACNLSAHMRSHTGEKPFECNFCNRRFSDRSTHIKHIRIHTNEKPFKCKRCGKSFSLSTSLKAHEKVHTGEKPYRCEPCDKRFKLPHQLKAHQNSQLHKNIVDHLN